LEQKLLFALDYLFGRRHREFMILPDDNETTEV
jgi:hypothetical protein